jgi:hypothetical protein
MRCHFCKNVFVSLAPRPILHPAKMSIVVWMIVFAFVASSPVDRISGQAPNRLSGESTSPEEQYVLGRTSGIEFPSHSGIFIEDLCTPRAAPRRDQRDSHKL